MTTAKTKKNNSSVLWWIVWILLTIGSFFVSAHFWTWFIADKVGPIRQPGVSILWVTAVFGSWMVLLVPLIVVMYNKVDKAYEDARIRRELAELHKTQESLKFRSALVDPSERQLSKGLSKRLKEIPETIKRGHLVTVILQDGKKYDNVFIADRSEILGIYGHHTLPFQTDEIADLEPADLKNLPDFKEEHWLRLDGVGNND
ncbi:MAG: hypothetical protein HYS56_03145 [Candidatus Omnitrophica bacterium]|nr:hypothetical protein [Candidatus Omnitrophota bacterium]